MAFIQLLLQPQRPSDEQEIYRYVANLTRLFAHRPAVYRAWQQLNTAIKTNMDLRRVEGPGRRPTDRVTGGGDTSQISAQTHAS